MGRRVKMTRGIPTILAVFWATCLVLGGVAAEAATKKRGPVTNLPMPRFVSMKAEEGNVRRGPSLTHRVDWVFLHENMPLKIVAEYGHWRRVQDEEGQGGWMHYSLLSGARYVRIRGEKVRMQFKPNDAAATNAYALRGALARLGSCNREWCEITAEGVSGWARKDQLWGVFADELRD